MLDGYESKRCPSTHCLRPPCVSVVISVQSTCRGALCWPVPGPWQCRAVSSRWAGRKSQSWRAWQSRSGLAGHTSTCATRSLGIWAPQEECLGVPQAGRDHCLSRWTWGGVVACPATRTLWSGGGAAVYQAPTGTGPRCLCASDFLPGRHGQVNMPSLSPGLEWCLLVFTSTEDKISNWQEEPRALDN